MEKACLCGEETVIAVNIKNTKAAVQRDFALTIISMSSRESQELDDRIDYEEFTLYSKIHN